MESVRLKFDDDVSFDKFGTVTFPKSGDLIHKMYLEIVLPEISFFNDSTNITKQNYIDMRDKYINEYKLIECFIKNNMMSYNKFIQIYNSINLTDTQKINNATTEINNIFNNNICVDGSKNVIDIINNTIITLDSPISDRYIFSKFIYDQLSLQSIINNIPTNDIDVLNSSISWAIQKSTYLVEHFQWLIESNNMIINNDNFYNYKFAWVKRLGHSIIDYVSIYIGGDIIDKHYGEWIDIWYELTSSYNMDESYMKMIGNVPELTDFNKDAKPSYTIYVPLVFWFNRHNGMALPLVSLQYHDVQLRVKLRKFSEVAYIDNDFNIDNAITPNLDNLFIDSNYNVTVNLLTDYIYLDSIERRKFAQSAHEYMIDVIQTHYDDTDIEEYKARLEFTNPSKELIWVVQRNSNLVNKNNSTETMWTNYGIYMDGTGCPVTQSEIHINGNKLFNPLSSSYFNYYNPNYFHSRTPVDGINCYSFALMPEENQPSGTCNMSRLSYVQLILNINSNMLYELNRDPATMSTNVLTDIPELLHVKIFSISQNILRIIGGMGSLAFI